MAAKTHKSPTDLTCMCFTQSPHQTCPQHLPRTTTNPKCQGELYVQSLVSLSKRYGLLSAATTIVTKKFLRAHCISCRHSTTKRRTGKSDQDQAQTVCRQTHSHTRCHHVHLFSDQPNNQTTEQATKHQTNTPSKQPTQPTKSLAKQ